MPALRFEQRTSRLQGECSGQLSYIGLNRVGVFDRYRSGTFWVTARNAGHYTTNTTDTNWTCRADSNRRELSPSVLQTDAFNHSATARNSGALPPNRTASSCSSDRRADHLRQKGNNCCWVPLFSLPEGRDRPAARLRLPSTGMDV